MDGLKVTASATQKNGASEPVGSVKSEGEKRELIAELRKSLADQ